MKHDFLRKKMYGLLVTASVFLLSSCTIGYDDDTTWTSELKGGTVESPEAESITFTPNATGTTAQITWPVSKGAKGYEFTFYNADDPNNLVPIGDEKEFIDGCKVNRDIQEDTRYKIVVKALGNEKYENKDAETSTEKEVSTLVKTYAVIPQGDIAEWFKANPVPQTPGEDGTFDEIAYELEANGKYTLSDKIDFGKRRVTFRGDKIYHPTITYGEDGGICTTAGLKIKFIDFDCNAMDGSSSTAAFLLFSSNPDESIKGASGSGDYYNIMDPILIQECNITGVQRHLIYDNKKKYCPKTLVIKDCLVELTPTQEQAVIYFNQGGINDLTIQNSTFWQKDGSPKNNNYFVQYNNSARPDRFGFTRSSINYLNSTFYHVCYNKQWGNYGGFAGRNTVDWNMKECIFLDCGNGQICRRFLGGRQNQATATFYRNTYWYNGAAENTSGYDNSGSAIANDPLLADPANYDFTVTAPEQIEARIGDPRWLPAATEE